jgi:hypothetical protein
MLFRDIYDVMSSYNDVTYYLLTRNLTPLHFMTSKVVQLRLITWEKLPLMKSDIGWVYITHSKVFIPSSHVHCFVFIDITLNILITMIDTCLSTQYYSITYFYYHISYVLFFIPSCVSTLFPLIIILFLTTSIVSYHIYIMPTAYHLTYG